ncbi:3-hydroxyisobutyrate dehydrogenase [Xaviernesmea oryzae]|uniref:3-hydroxyisobutyrate dehydrogenase n=1 Tax=Xaviernesmea oryzae TaxID=464029 RepID=A0A1Q9AU69_9HYPH|nr:NAD(P)-dependent oxidoreductase [Xaviernesmea oryzae]OLP58894.1 3-hydroxyisobutyrate dehydrogenase [Xaviernesmea oryzae]SEM02654.1 3-hydroxyisobutyrate dehydrogenase [Xaviernesmea oryzae]
MSNQSKALVVAVLGTGLIGAPVARNLARKGFDVRVWNRTADKARALATDGAQPFDQVQDATRGADVIVTVLKDGPAVHEAVAAALPEIARDTVWLQLSTVGLSATEALADLAVKHGLVFYDAPVQGTRQPAEQGKLVILASGPESNRDTAQQVFDAISQRTIWVSDQPGASSRLKLALNAFVFALTHGTAETLAIAKALGIEPALVVNAITGGPLDSGYFQAKSAAMLNGDYSTSFSVDNGVKDANLVLDALAGTDFQADLAEAGLNRFRRAGDAGHGGKDIAASFLV